MSGQESQEQNSAIVPWDYRRYAKVVEPDVARLSRGFLRCRPEKWFPGFATQWLPLVHSLGAEVRIVEVKPTLSVPGGLERGFTGSVDDEPLSIFIEDPSAHSLLEAVTPGVLPSASGVVLEYLARRFLASLALSWTGPSQSVVRYEPEIEPTTVREAGAIKLTFSINGATCTVWVGLGPGVVERFDGLWRRQVRSATKSSGGQTILRAELAQLAVPPSMLGDYTRSGAVIDLEMPVGDQLIVRADNRPLFLSRICAVHDNLALECVPGTVAAPLIPDGSTRLAVEFAGVPVEAAILAEVAQFGAVFDTGVPLSNEVRLMVNGEPVAKALLCTYEGRFALSVR